MLRCLGVGVGAWDWRALTHIRNVDEAQGNDNTPNTPDTRPMSDFNSKV